MWWFFSSLLLLILLKQRFLCTSIKWTDKWQNIRRTKYPFMGMLWLGDKKPLCNTVLITQLVAVTDYTCLPEENIDYLYVCMGVQIDICVKVKGHAYLPKRNALMALHLHRRFNTSKRNDIGVAKMSRSSNHNAWNAHCWHISTDFDTSLWKLWFGEMTINENDTIIHSRPLFYRHFRYQTDKCPREVGAALYCDNHLVIGLTVRESICSTPVFGVLIPDIVQFKYQEYEYNGDGKLSILPNLMYVSVLYFEV